MKRYAMDAEAEFGQDAWVVERESSIGAWVRHDEAAAELTRLRTEVERLQAHSYRLECWLRSNMQEKTANLARAERAEAALSDERAHADALAGALS
uniref:hypothetical protein n=1 Tax=Paracoccus sp. TRP TaxID=412597 RepID=UPI000225FC1B|nr:hypothetical protein [Paracoccus sp. TRP]